MELVRALSSGLLANRIPTLPKVSKRPRRPPRRRIHQVQVRLKPDQIQELVEAYRAGATLPELSARFGLHEHTVTEHLKRHSIDRRVNGKKLSPEDIEKAADLYRSGLSWVAIAEQFDVNPQTIGTWLKRAGVPMRPRQGGPPSKAPGRPPKGGSSGRDD